VMGLEAVFEILQNLESVATQFTPLVLIAPGVISVICGLFIWLGGLGFRKLLLALVGAIAGAGLAFYFSDHNIIMVLFAAVIGSVITLVFERILITLLATALIGAVALAILVTPYSKDTPHESSGRQDQVQYHSSDIGGVEAIHITHNHARTFFANFKDAAKRIHASGWVLVGAVALAVILLGRFFWRLTSALFFSLLGTMLIFGGMVLLLCFKGSAPISAIGARAAFYGVVFAAMVTFGTAEQIILCKVCTRDGMQKGPDQNDRRRKPAKTTWRTR